MGRFALQFGPFRKVKWTVSQIGMGTGAAEGGIFTEQTFGGVGRNGYLCQQSGLAVGNQRGL